MTDVVRDMMEVIETVGCYTGKSDKLVSSEDLNCLLNLKKAVLGAKKLLKKCSCGSNIYLALDAVPYDEFGISVEVKEQFELMHMQLKRAKGRTDTQDIELAMDIMVVFSKKDECNVDIAVRKLIKERDVRNAESIQQITDLLGKLKQIAGVDETIELDGPISKKSSQELIFSLIPLEFLCSITLEIMVAPKIVATGQTYERESMQNWLSSNHRTCPKTRQTLDHLSLAPNFALRNLILQWCEKNNFELPKKDLCEGYDGSNAELIKEISCLVEIGPALSLIESRQQSLIANIGAIPPLFHLLSYQDSMLQEQPATALLNLLIDEANKRIIAREGAIPAIIDILQNGTEEARENSTAALFSLSMLDENRVLVGTSNGIPPLVNLLQDGTIRGRKDAATALFNLSLNQTNKFRAIKADIITPWLHLLGDKNIGMIDEALSILLLLASHPKGRSEIGRLSFIRTLVEIIKSGTPKNKECATSVLLELGVNNSSFTLAALQYGVYEHLVDIARCGTNGAQRKANSLLQHMSKCEHIP
ncbi:hypothetical protein P3X46_010609 [Hevea brasiliensis]|uniref:RING-type E3 ubiquitin transferase n=1 Tax=Hevea brasiliensis TaxID=3981 RepID=A0ABQ9MH04_HEVBR|nr:hypothetical protein P3X46_010609 [Hevea brasiliensis]